jgi:hypothetical protein
VPKRTAAVSAGTDSFDIFTAAIEALHIDRQLAATLPRPKPLYHVLPARQPLCEPFNL